MKLSTVQAALGSAASLLLTAQPVVATLSHRHVHNHYAKRHTHGHTHQLAHELRDAQDDLVKRTDGCSLPNHPDLVRVPGADNNGFAMSPDQRCVNGGYCPIACVPGKVMAQWEPNTTYVYPQSMVSLYISDATWIVR
jgi:hypothetical protein